MGIATLVKGKNMSQTDLQKAETVSALMDGEVDELTLHRTLKNIDQDPELRASWRRYHLVSAAMTDELPERMVDLSSRISEAIAQEKAPQAVARRWLQPLGRFAIAASVTVVAVLGVQQYGPQQQQTPLTAVTAQRAETDILPMQSALQMPQIPVRTVSAIGEGQHNPRPVDIKQQIADRETYERVQQYLNDRMLRHTENAAINANQGMMPFARMPNIPAQER